MLYIRIQHINKDMRPFQQILLLLTAILPAKAVAGPESVMADSMPDRWQYVSEFIQAVPTDDRWWQSFDDPLLDSLIALGVDRNFNILAAMRRIEVANQAVRQARAGYYPNIGVSGGWTKSRSSGNMIPGGRPENMDYFSLGASMSWEIDVFGRISAKAKRMKSLYRASRAEYAAVMVSMCGEIARNYAALRTAQEQLEVARRHIVSQDSVLHIAEARFDAELASKLDIEQASTICYSTKATIPSLEAQIETSINAIALLIGEYPENISLRLKAPAPLPDYRQIVGAGIPKELIRRRPDVVEAECQLAAAAQAVGIAKKDFLPVLSIQGSIGTSAHNAGDLFDRNSFIYSIAPTISWTVFDGMARNAALVSAREQLKATVDQYNLAVLTAVQEVDNAMANYLSAMKEAELLADVVEHASNSFDLSFDLYRSGLSSFTNVADAQISYLQYASSLAAAKGNALTALVSLYQALGGGWSEQQ